MPRSAAASPAPPTDLAGNTFTTALGVGAHQAHLQGRSRISAPVACATCHVVPAASDALPHTLAPGPAAVIPGLGWEIGQRVPANPMADVDPSKPIAVKSVLGGLHVDYRRAA